MSKCAYCGKVLSKGEVVAKCSSAVSHFLTRDLFSIGDPLCKDCAKKCPKCNKFYCPKHLETHTCKELK